ncbi:hypothetical protein [Streptomyces sp. H27-H5]|uniref:hypothetical protein n=1 Tax=Streptomyces sp. H27-H5 TaxID=2996460 RepID=UPI00226F5D58|nr:hypothetical protein [Streptomyces sp. H27-H5]MCY0960831.1 hypothetical protein [Streptomyces sp. H27-H5]
MTAHPPRTRWHVETYDPLAAEWSSGLPLPTKQAAIEKRTRLDKQYPTFRTGAPCQRRIVLETTTFIDLDVDPIACFPQGGFVLTDHAGQDLAAVPDQTPDGRPAMRIGVGSCEVGHAETTVPLDRLEEVIAGLREMARQQAADQPVPSAGCQCIAQTTAADRIYCDPCRTGSADGELRVELAGHNVTAHLSDPEAERQRAEHARQAAAGTPITAEQNARARKALPESAVVTAAAVRATEPRCGHSACDPYECFEVAR